MTLVQERWGRLYIRPGVGATAQGSADWAELTTQGKVGFIAKEQGGFNAWKPLGGNIRGQRASG